jgi:hypothetical protein
MTLDVGDVVSNTYRDEKSTSDGALERMREKKTEGQKHLLLDEYFSNLFLQRARGVAVFFSWMRWL